MTGDEHPERVGYVSFVVRCVPRVDREEFCNIGVVLYSQMADFLAVAHDVPSARLAALAPDLDLDAVLGALATMDAVCRGDASAGPLAAATRRERFGWLSAPRSTVVQPGPVHGGLTHDPAAELTRLLAHLVG
jgi:hypothetical protein